jgi:predicted secreted hydrolase
MRHARGVILAFLAGWSAVVSGAQHPGGWRRAERGRLLHLPGDHVSHPEYRIEWWYYTGNVAAASGRRFGYQLTFFRIGVDPAPSNPSRWTVRDLVMAHFAITDVAGKRHHGVEKLTRPVLGWAGARADRYHVWIDDWSVGLTEGRHHLVAESAAPPLRLDLSLAEGKAPALHGDRGYSQKGSDSGNASHYYSLTRMPTRGTIGFEGERFDVEGESWMDHEFGSSFLEATQTGWDWLSAQLDDGTDLMLYALRARDGSIDPRSSGTLVAGDGHASSFPAGAFALTPGRRWTSPTSRASYPVEWRVDVPADRLALIVKAAVDVQEMHAGLQSGVAYWEGAVDISGTRGGRPVTGRGYFEMTGYTGRPMAEILGGTRP